ncbi:Transcriptional regulatory protein moc3 [Pleurostoma richardsiae]|uniref:Transcriptional regulatory protein moc3 n=1 Tax=Pleurostoma richardsiae TaxID=41990 RepID=A0AA38VJN2_9PEZI|nr:Transcriptional regulatory protein moc3 [Pleurostoma richardsiae]
MGRPPTSGYCHTCRKRRIKCDKARPSCHRCLKSGYTCKGYDLGLRMQSLVVVTEPEGSQRLAKISTLPQPKAPHQGPEVDDKGGAGDSTDGSGSATTAMISSSPSTLRRGSTSTSTNTLTSVSSNSISSTSSRSSSGTGSPAPEMNLVAFKEEMAFSYFFATYGWAGFWKPFLSLAREVDLAQVSHMGALALAYGHMGLGRGARDLQSQGLELYCHSLHEVQSLLTRSNAAAKTAIARLAVPVLVLGMYSYAVDRDLRLVHHLGVAQILQHCGPESFQDEPLLTTFRSCRAQLVCQSFAYRRRTFVEEDQWRTVPFLKNGKTWLDRLFDVMAAIPGVVHDMAASERPASPATKLFFARRVRELAADLHRWRWGWARAHRGAARAVPSRRLAAAAAVRTPAFRELLATELELGSVSQALELLTYNAGLAYLMQLEDVLGISERTASTTGSGGGGGDPLSFPDMDAIRAAAAAHPDDPLLLPSEARFPWQAAAEALRVVPYLRDNLLSSDERVMVPLAPIGIVYCALRAHPELSRCMEHSVLSEIPFFRDAPRELSAYGIAMGRDWLS